MYNVKLLDEKYQQQGLTIKNSAGCLLNSWDNYEEMLEKFRRVDDRYESCDNCDWEDWLPGSKPPRMYCPKCKKTVSFSIKQDREHFNKYVRHTLPKRPIRRPW